MTAELMLDHRPRSPRPLGFEDWRARLDREHISPVIAIAGSRGKTSVLRAVESILRAGGHRFASWTNHGVEIDGEKQRGELGPWSRALTSLTAGGLEVALQEVDWATVQALGTPTSSHPVLAVVNLCANNETCLVTPDTLLARKALDRIRASVAPTGRLILNADDYAVATERESESADRYFVGMSAEAPVMRRHLLEGGDACWLSGSSIVIQENDRTRPIVDTRWLRWTRGGRIPFAVQTALIATAVARASGIPEQVVSAGLVAHDARPESMPGSFNVFDVGSATVVVERPMPSWFLRASVRATSNLGAGRQIRLAGPMTSVATEDLPEIGRLLGRSGGILIIHGDWTADRLDLIRQGASGNEVPPIVVQAHDERSAILQGLDIVRPDDVMLVLAENPTAAIRMILRRIRRDPTASAREPRSAV